MSIQAIRCVFERSRSRGSARLVLLALADHADGNMTAWPSVETLRRKVNLRQRKNVHNALDELLALDEIEKAGTAKRGVIKYRLNLPEYPAVPMSEETYVPSDTCVSRDMSPVSQETEVPVSQETPEPLVNHHGTIKGADAPASTPRERVFGEFRRYLKTAAGMSDTAARALLGKWLKELQDDDELLVGILTTARAKEVQEPRSYVEAAVRKRKQGRTAGTVPGRRVPDEVF